MSFYVQPYNASQLPTGGDRADGLSGRLGTATPSNQIQYQSAQGATVPIEEFPDSPTLERSEQFTATHRLTMSWADGLDRLSGLYRGLIFADANTEDASQFKLLSARLTHGQGGKCVLELTSECVNAETPPDEFSVTPIELGISILKHPRYFKSLRGSTSTQNILNQYVIRFLQDYIANPNVQMRNAVIWQLKASIGHLGSVAVSGEGLGNVIMPAKITSGIYDGVYPIPGTDLAKRAAIEIIQKYWLGVETPYVVGWQIVYSTYYARSQELSPGGYLENPYDLIDEQFIIDPDVDPTIGATSVSQTIFSKMAALNPTCYSSTGKADGTTSISWLRKADQVSFMRTFYRVDRTWIGSPIGHWDADLFSQGELPINPSDYHDASATWCPVYSSRPTV